jgi:hypothetical protein
MGFEPTTPVYEWAEKVYASERAAAATGFIRKVLGVVSEKR